MVHWAYFPRSARPTDLALSVVGAFQAVHASISSETNTLESNAVLEQIRPGLVHLGFKVESGKKVGQKISVPVLYGNDGLVAKSFDADAHHVEGRFVVEVEAGRGVINNQFLKDLFQACMMDDVEYLSIAVRNTYSAAGVRNADFNRVVTFFDTLYASHRMALPLKGILVIGY
jgi:hypothetical protein